MKRGAGSVAARARALCRLLKRKVLRDTLPPRRVAAGWALGMFVGCAVPFGLQLVVSIPLAVATRTSKIGATLGTFITNPVTILFIYPAQTVAVHKLLFGCCVKLPEEWTFDAVMAMSGQAIASYLLGGVLLGVVLAPATYFAVLRLVAARRARKAAEEAAA